MTIFQAIILGIVQGFTEFFPISSSGHLVILQVFFGFKEPMIAFDIFLHLGSLLAILIYFRNDILRLFSKDRRTGFLILLASAPTFVIALIFKDAVEKMFSDARLVGFALVVTGLWLFLADWRERAIKGKKELGPVRSLIIGFAQGIAIIPGISRSGSTIGSGLITGLKREEAFRFSFLLSVPAVAGACLFKFKKIEESFSAGQTAQFLLGGSMAFLVGIAAIHILSKLVRNRKIFIFGAYCIFAGLAVIILCR